MFKKILFLLLGILIVSCEKETIDVSYTSTLTNISTTTELSITESYNEIPINGTRWELIDQAIHQPHGNLVYEIDGEMYLLVPGAGYFGESDGYPILFKQVDGKWEYLKSFPSIGIEMIRNHRKVNSTTFIWGEASENDRDTCIYNNGCEVARPSNAWVVNVIKDDVIFTKINTETDWFHDISHGDLDGDGLFDIVWNSRHVYFQNPDGTFHIERNVFPDTYGTVYFSVEIGNLFGDSKPEVVKTNYLDAEHAHQKNGFLIYQFNENTRKMDLIVEGQNPMLRGDSGGNYSKIIDINKDGYNDLLLGREGNAIEHGSTVEVWLGDGTTNLTPYDVIGDSNKFQFWGFELLDVNNDSYLDIIFKGGNGRTRLGSRHEDGFRLNDLIWLNDGSGKFENYNDTELVGGQGTIMSKFIPYMKNGNLTFWGGVTDYNYTDVAKVRIYDVEILNLK